MNPFGTRGAADELARLLDTGATTGPVPGIALAAQLRSTGAVLEAAVAPRAEFRDALRMRLMAVASVQAAAPVAVPTPAPAPVRALEAALAWRRRGGAVAAGAMASVVAVSGVAVAGSQSLPGDPFYGVKRTTEAFQLRTADGDVEKGTRHLDFAATRLREVRGLTLGRDAVDDGPALGPSALSAGIVLRSAEQPLAAGAALAQPVADRVRATLAEMDEQTREGSALLTRAHRSSQAPEPLRALSRFATRQTAGLEQLLPALPSSTRSYAQASLALLTDVSTTTDELLGLAACAAACDPTSDAPTLPDGSSDPAAPPPADCACPTPAPAPTPQSTAGPTPQPAPTPSQPERSGSPAPAPTSAPSPSPTPGNPLPVPLPTPPVPVPTLPIPVPSITLPPADDVLDPVLEPVEELLDPLIPGSIANATSGGSTPVPTPAPTPVPRLAPAPPRP